MMPPDQVPLAYDSQLFVDRDEHIKLVLDKVRALRHSEKVDKRTVIFYGAQGAGKSWLLRELRERLQATEFETVKKTLIDLRDYHKVTLPDGIQKIHLKIAEAVQPATDPPHPNPVQPDPILVFNHILEQRGNPLVVLVDSVDEASPNFLALCEEYILALLAKEPHVILVLGMRLPQPLKYPWKSPELRIYSEERDLWPFGGDADREHWAQAQLKKLGDKFPEAVARTREIIDLGYGYPLNNLILARELPSGKSKALQQCAANLLDLVAHERQEYFRALCVLRSFDQDRLPYLLAAYLGRAVTDWRPQQCREIMDQLVNTRLVRWNRDAGGYVMDEALRVVLENSLQQSQPELRIKLHQAALALYTDWVMKYPRAGERWQKEAAYHADCL